MKDNQKQIAESSLEDAYELKKIQTWAEKDENATVKEQTKNQTSSSV